MNSGCNGHIPDAALFASSVDNSENLDEDQITQYVRSYMSCIVDKTWEKEEEHPFQDFKAWLKHRWPNTDLAINREIEYKMRLIFSMETYSPWILINPDPTEEECNGPIDNDILFAF